jgi:hypothetical protein
VSRPAHRRNAVTDRALRYRAVAHPPEGRKICCMCGSTRYVGVDHVDGWEENSAPKNLMWACKACNTRKGFAFKRAGLGRRTHQFNPAARGAKNLGQWILAVMSAKGESDAMTVSAAVEMIHATSQRKRSEFATEIWRRRRARGTDRSSLEVPF